MPSTSAELNREAVLKAMDECDSLELGPFLAKYGFRQPREYWVARDESARRYPAKAIVGAAYGHLPGGKPLESSGFFGGLNGANRELERLGFVISKDNREGLRLEPRALAALKAKFLEIHPGFQVFGESPSFDDTEGNYKRALVNRAAELIRDDTGRNDADLGEALWRLATAGSGLPSNLIDWRAATAVNDARQANPELVDAALGKMVRDTDDVRSVMHCVDKIWPTLVEARPGSKPYAESRMVTSMIRALVHPDTMIGIRSTPMNNAHIMLLGSPLFEWRPLHQEELERALAMAGALFRVMAEEWSWAPRNLWDVQGFIWETCQKVFQTDGASTTMANEMERESAMIAPTNLILYGPPGTGKTYATAYDAVRLCYPDACAENGGPLYPDTAEGRLRWLGATDARNELMDRYNELRKSKRIEFVTFHQSYDYESFVEGLRPETAVDAASGAGFRLVPQPGCFREIARLAEEAASPATGENAQTGARFEIGNRKVFKMSLGRGGSEEHIYDDAIENGIISLGWGGTIDWTPFNSYDAVHARWNQDHPDTNGNDGNIVHVFRFRVTMKPGDIVLISAGNTAIRAIAEVTGDYTFEPQAAEHRNRRTVRWLKVFDDPIAVDTVYDRAFSMRSCYLLKEKYLKREALQTLLAGVAAAPSEIADEASGPSSQDTAGNAPPARLPQFVLIIDEINRGNISKIFGELITLIEPDKRIGMENALKVTLPYSKRSFGVPANLHIVGTMNTADRSIALLDTALRRRFAFREMAPDPATLADSEARTGLPLVTLLATINARIEYLLDREHRIGHAFFIGCKDKDGVHAVMRDKVIPLLQEYFFEDFARVHLVLGEGFITSTDLPAPPGFEGRGEARKSWSVRDAFGDSAYWSLAGLAPKVAIDDDQQ